VEKRGGMSLRRKTGKEGCGAVSLSRKERRKEERKKKKHEKNLYFARKKSSKLGGNPREGSSKHPKPDKPRTTSGIILSCKL
jgi:hypothetical protein